MRRPSGGSCLRPLSPAFWVALALATGTSPAVAADGPTAFAVPKEVRAVFGAHCADCHAEGGKGNVDVTTLDKLKLSDRLETLNKIQDQLFYKMMPPPKAEQPSAKDRQVLADWLRVELRQHQASKLDERLPLPSSGNYVDHAALFNGTNHEKPYTPARRWLVSPQIFRERVLDSLRLEGRARQQHLYGVNNPFTLPERSGVRDYDLTTLEGTHFVTLKANAAWLADKVIGSLRVKQGEPREKVFENPKDRWFPPNVGPDGKQPLMAAFEVIVTRKGMPTDDEMAAAIQMQFDRVLARPASDAELKRYLKLMRSTVELGGNTEGLRKMLEAVWLESEFVYRLEFGAGQPDQFGRKMLSPREASYAIAYALGDKGPDAALAKAAREGRLNTRADYEREVRRLLADESQLKGMIDPLLHEIYPTYPKNNLSLQPKSVRFFREFFGYPMALRVFKDFERSDGYYRNPDRGSTQTPGQLVREADLFVDGIVQKDQSVFETLLTSEKFYVAPVDKAGAKIDALKEIYERFKDTNWRLDPKLGKAPPPKLPDEDLAFIRKRLEYNSDARHLQQAMLHLEHYRKKGLDPHPLWSYPFGIHMLTPWAHSYNIAPPDWEYPREQPFTIPHRKGILTHPAWLIAHSQNSATDPVRRGKWIREKLLAGVVPDVPITVDAQIPEHKDKTLRERLDLVTNQQSCVKCHQHMNPLGLAFETYDDFGRYRTVESLEHPENLISKAKAKYGANTYKTKPVVTTGRFDGTGDPKLDGDVADAIDLIDRLAKSERVRQSIIRHAFRFYLGRNEMPSDSQTLIDADRAYVTSGGSFKAVIVSLLTSDSFLYRK